LVNKLVVKKRFLETISRLVMVNINTSVYTTKNRIFVSSAKDNQTEMLKYMMWFRIKSILWT